VFERLSAPVNLLAAFHLFELLLAQRIDKRVDSPLGGRNLAVHAAQYEESLWLASPEVSGEAPVECGEVSELGASLRAERSARAPQYERIEPYLADASKILGNNAVKRVADSMVLLDERVEEVDLVGDALEEKQRLDGV
jgi:hypothetical protein